MTTKVIQADREAAEPFRRGKGGKYDRNQEMLAYAFASHADPLRRALEEISSQAICYGMAADEAELREWLRHIFETAERVIAPADAALSNTQPSPAYSMENNNGE